MLRTEIDRQLMSMNRRNGVSDHSVQDAAARMPCSRRYESPVQAKVFNQYTLLVGNKEGDHPGDGGSTLLHILAGPHINTDRSE